MGHGYIVHLQCNYLVLKLGMISFIVLDNTQNIHKLDTYFVHSLYSLTTGTMAYRHAGMETVYISNRSIVLVPFSVQKYHVVINVFDPAKGVAAECPRIPFLKSPSLMQCN